MKMILILIVTLCAIQRVGGDLLIYGQNDIMVLHECDPNALSEASCSGANTSGSQFSGLRLEPRLRPSCRKAEIVTRSSTTLIMTNRTGNGGSEWSTWDESAQLFARAKPLRCVTSDLCEASGCKMSAVIYIIHLLIFCCVCPHYRNAKANPDKHMESRQMPWDSNNKPLNCETQTNPVLRKPSAAPHKPYQEYLTWLLRACLFFIHKMVFLGLDRKTFILIIFTFSVNIFLIADSRLLQLMRTNEISTSKKNNRSWYKVKMRVLFK